MSTYARHKTLDPQNSTLKQSKSTQILKTVKSWSWSLRVEMTLFQDSWCIPTRETVHNGARKACDCLYQVNGVHAGSGNRNRGNGSDAMGF